MFTQQNSHYLVSKKRHMAIQHIFQTIFTALKSKIYAISINISKKIFFLCWIRTFLYLIIKSNKKLRSFLQSLKFCNSNVGITQVLQLKCRDDSIFCYSVLATQLLWLQLYWCLDWDWDCTTVSSQLYKWRYDMK